MEVVILGLLGLHLLTRNLYAQVVEIREISIRIALITVLNIVLCLAEEMELLAS